MRCHLVIREVLPYHGLGHAAPGEGHPLELCSSSAGSLVREGDQGSDSVLLPSLALHYQ